MSIDLEWVYTHTKIKQKDEQTSVTHPTIPLSMDAFKLTKPLILILKKECFHNLLPGIKIEAV